MGVVSLVILVATALPFASSAAVAHPAQVGRGRSRSVQARPDGMPAVQAYPAPGTVAAMPATGITFRDLNPSAAASVQVSGSASGAHAVIRRVHRDGRGVTLQPRVAFAPAESVTVRGLAVSGGDGDRFSFTVARPGRHPGLGFLSQDVPAAGARPASRGTNPTRAPRSAEGPPYRTRPDLNPPTIRAGIAGNNTAPGALLVTPTDPRGSGEMLAGNNGQPYWYRPAPRSVVAGDLEKARYRGRDVLVWFEGTELYAPGSYRGTWTMVDQTYRRIATIRAANGMQADIHDIDINAAGRAYLIIYNPVIRDLSAYGGSRSANVLELVIQEVDIASGDLIFEWHSLNSFPVTDSYKPITDDPVDYIHGNSLSQDTDENLLVSARHTSTVFKINRSTDQVMWRLGGRRNQFTFSPSGEPRPGYQHHALRIAPGVISIFDNGTTVAGFRASRGVQYRLNESAHTATRIKEQKHTPDLFAFSQGSYQQLAGGHSLISWGNLGTITEYDSAGAVRFEASVPGSYRAFRNTWQGRPARPPEVVAERRTGHDTVFASWNGATDVASWEVRAGASRSSLATVRTAPRDGFETAINIPSSRFVQVRGRTAGNALLGTSAVVPVGPWFSERSTLPAGGSYRPFTGNFTGGRGDDVVFYAPGSARDYLWSEASGGMFVDTALPAVGGDYAPLVGDFVGDAHDDILWRRPGQTSAYLWRSNGTGGFDDVKVDVPAARLATVLHHRSGPDEVLWYNPGGGYDEIAGYRWNIGGAPSRHQRAISVNGVYRPVVGDFDGNGWADIVWYGPGSRPDQFWRLTGNRGGASFGQVTSALRISGSYSPLVGRFSPVKGDRDDIAWYARGGAPDYVWEGASAGRFVETSHTNSATGDPLLLHGVQDHLYLRTAGAGGTIWVPNGRPDLVRPSGNSAFGSSRRPIVGDFGGTGTSGILWYAPGSAPERLFSPRLG